jgi:MATE family multidrug resistance protein
MLKLALPVILTYLGFMLMGTVDIYFVGRLSPLSIGAVGVGTSIFAWFMVFGAGLLGGLDYLAAYAFGARDPDRAFDALVQALIVMLGLSLPLMLAILVLATHLDWFGVNGEVAPLAAEYLRILGWSLPLTYLFNAIRQYLTAQGIALPGMVILGIANVVNALGNWLWVEGHAGFAARGVAGSAEATVWARLLSLVLVVAYLVYHDARGGADGRGARCLWRLPTCP